MVAQKLSSASELADGFPDGPLACPSIAGSCSYASAFSQVHFRKCIFAQTLLRPDTTSPRHYFAQTLLRPDTTSLRHYFAQTLLRSDTTDICSGLYACRLSVAEKTLPRRPFSQFRLLPVERNSRPKLTLRLAQIADIPAVSACSFVLDPRKRNLLSGLTRRFRGWFAKS